jgi:hypothetical protein
MVCEGYWFEIVWTLANKKLNVGVLYLFGDSEVRHKG